MNYFDTGCLICGSDIIYYSEKKELFCHICGQGVVTSAACEKGHYICDSCHARRGIQVIMEEAAATKSSDPFEIADKIMANPFINTHGPEHHFIVPAVLIAAYCNAGGTIEYGLTREKALEEALSRAITIPGGHCGYFGNCGAAVGTGIFISIVTGANPLSKKPWAWANTVTGLSLVAIGGLSGPRCCKRNTYLSLMQAVDLANVVLEVEMGQLTMPECTFYYRNRECLGDQCLFFPRG